MTLLAPHITAFLRNSSDGVTVQALARVIR
jgi:hypothetical protein